jgi:hypothetical protein
MTKDTLLLALDAERLKTAGEAITVPEEREATFIIGAHGDTMQIGKVVRIEARDSVLCLENAKGERTWFTYDLVLGVQLRSAKSGKEQGAGFVR